MKRSKHSLSHYKLLSMDLGNIIPLACYEVLPGDTVQQSTSMLIRVAPLLSPVMHPVFVRVHHWFVPYRLIWENWEPFITGGDDGNDISEPPVFSEEEVTQSSLHDYLGIPPADYDSTGVSWSALPIRAYNLIYNEFYRDQDLVDPVDISLEDGIDTTTSTDILRAAWAKDYFTSARPWEQKGDSVTIPIFGDSSLPVSGIAKQDQTFSSSSVAGYETDGSGTTTYTNAAVVDNAAGMRFYVEEDPNNSGYPNLRADLTGVEGISVNDLRLGLGLQRFKEARARFGSRYTEYLRYYGISPADARLQRPEYLGGGRQTIQFSEVLQTSPATGSYVGDLKGHGIAAMRSNRYRRFIPEHGLIMSVCSVIPKAIYSNSIHRSFLRRTKEDYFTKELQFIGQQSITNQEIYSEHSSPTGVFGYQDKYDEYRRHPSSIAGEFRNELNYWHYARIFSGDVALNSSFINATPTNRVYASTDTHPLYVMVNHSIQARRMVVKNAQPRII